MNTTMNNNKKEKAVIVIDLQKCFLPGGNLPTDTNSSDTGLQLGTNTANFIKQLKPNHLFISLDWHPEKHISFRPDFFKNVKTNKKKNSLLKHFYSTEKYEDKDIKIKRLWGNYDERLKQSLWPPHCVQNTEESKVVSTFNVEDFETLNNPKPKYILKGFNTNVDSYSIVADALGDDTPYVYNGTYDDLYNKFKNLDNQELKPTIENRFLNILKNSTINEVYLTGIARNVCVYWSAMDLLQFWILPAYFSGKIIKLYFVYDLTRPVVSTLFDAGLDISPEKIESDVKLLIDKFKEVNNITDTEDTEILIKKIFEVKNSSQVISMNGGSKKTKHKHKYYNKSRKTRKHKSKKNYKSKKTSKYNKK